MKLWPLILLPLLLACEETTAPEVDCRGELVVVTTATRFATDTAVVCDFPPPSPPDTVVVTDTVTVEPPCDDDEDHHHGHGHHHHDGHRHGGHR